MHFRYQTCLLKEIILPKLRAMGFDWETMDWFNSYLKSREQRVDALSDPLLVTCGVQQRFIP